jgi:serine protease Do
MGLGDRSPSAITPCFLRFGCRLVKDWRLFYGLAMLLKPNPRWLTGLVGMFLLGAGPAAPADEIELHDAAAVTGKILAEKPDSVVVDVGYTVLVIPQSQIVKITHNDKAGPAKKSDAVPTPAAGINADSKLKSNLYYVAGKNAPARSVRDLVKQLGEAVVQVRTPGGLGSGFILNEDGYLITNFHVIEGETQISVEVYHEKNGQLARKTYKDVRIVALNKFADLTLLKIDDKDAPKFDYVTLGDSETLAVGDHVFAIGSPLGLERTVTEGILSTKTREMQGDLYLQTTAQINPGNSGGPLFNLNGDVVGVTNMKITFGEGLGFAIPVTIVKYFLDHRDAFSYSNDNPSNPYRYLEPPSRTRHTEAR